MPGGPVDLPDLVGRGTCHRISDIGAIDAERFGDDTARAKHASSSNQKAERSEL